MEKNTPKIEIDAITTFLLEIELFKHLPKQALQDLAKSLTVVVIRGGETLIRQGDLDTSMYILFQGRLRVLAREEESSLHKDQTLAEISVGQIVGEIALLTHLPRTTTVRAIRDSVLLKLDESSFKELEKTHTAEVLDISKMALTRVMTKPRATQSGENVAAITIVPSGNSNHRLFAEHLAQELNKIKPTILITQETCNQFFGRKIAQAEFEAADTLQIAGWLQSLERQYGYLVFVTDHELSHWSERCIRQADRIICVAEHWKSPELNNIENFLFSDKTRILPYIEIAFVHPGDQKTICGTERWLKNRFYNAYHHLRLGHQPDYDKFIRFLTGRAFGVVLNGGGARASAHIGLFKALSELKIPIDFIAGTSGGATAAAAYASKSYEEMIEFSEYCSKNFRIEWTLPLTALLKGKFASECFHNYWKEIRIEDLWTRFFCISTNLTEAKIKIHDRGPVWLAIRASTSVPAIYPPIYDEEGNMLVDGGVMNNMPVDVMRKMISGGKILAVNCHIQAQELVRRKSSQDWISGWNLFLQKFNPFLKEKLEYENILNILLASVNLSSSAHQKRMGKEADYYIEFDTHKYNPGDFTKWDQLIEIGYRTSIEKLPGLFA